MEETQEIKIHTWKPLCFGHSHGYAQIVQNYRRNRVEAQRTEQVQPTGEIACSVQSLSHAWFFVTPWTAAHHISLSITSYQSLLKFMSIESVMPSNISSSVIPFFSCLQSFPASGSFPVSQLFPSGGQSVGVSASASVLPLNIQDWFPLGWTGWISL